MAFLRRAFGSPQRLVVSKSAGDARFSSITSALVGARPGAVVLVEPGEYREPIVVDRDVQIAGTDGHGGSAAPGSVVIAPTVYSGGSGGAINVYAGRVTLRNVTIDYKSPEPQGSAIFIGMGASCEVGRCVVRNRGGVGVTVADTATMARFSQCNIEGSEQAVAAYGPTTLVDCSIWHCRLGIWIDGGPVSVERTSIRDIEEDGVHLRVGNLSLVDSVVHKCGGTGIHAECIDFLMRSCCLAIAGSGIRENGGSQIVVGEGAYAKLVGTWVGEGAMGIEIRDDGRVDLDGVSVFKNRGAGLAVGAGGHAGIVSSHIDQNLIGLLVCTRGHAELNDCTVDANSTGIMASAGANGLISDSRVFANGEDVRVESGSYMKLVNVLRQAPEGWGWPRTNADGSVSFDARRLLTKPRWPRQS